MNDTEQPDDRPGNNTAITIIEPATGFPVPAMIAAAGERPGCASSISSLPTSATRTRAPLTA
jgi:hypothetical protein